MGHASGFSAKKVRALTKKFSNFAVRAKSPEKSEEHRRGGGQGGIPPLYPPSAPPALLLAFWEISGTKAKGIRGEKTMARL